MEPSCHDYVPIREHEFVRDDDDDRGLPFGQVAYVCQFCPVIDWRYEDPADDVLNQSKETP